MLPIVQKETDLLMASADDYLRLSQPLLSELKPKAPLLITAIATRRPTEARLALHVGLQPGLNRSAQ